MKKLTALMLSLTLMLGAFAGCSSGKADDSPSPSPELTAEERTELYVNAITGARSEEDNTYNSIITSAQDTDADMILEMLGITADNADAFAISLSLMNVRAYCVALIKPAEGSEETVETGLKNFVENQKQSFEFYLADQYDIAAASILETLDDGTMMLVMSEGAEDVAAAIKTALSGSAE